MKNVKATDLTTRHEIYLGDHVTLASYVPEDYRRAALRMADIETIRHDGDLITITATIYGDDETYQATVELGEDETIPANSLI